jgi:hypothetical protein
MSAPALRLFDVRQEVPVRKRTCMNCCYAAVWSCYPGMAHCHHPEGDGLATIRGGCDYWSAGKPPVDGGLGARS